MKSFLSKKSEQKKNFYCILNILNFDSVKMHDLASHFSFCINLTFSIEGSTHTFLNRNWFFEFIVCWPFLLLFDYHIGVSIQKILCKISITILKNQLFNLIRNESIVYSISYFFG